MTKRAYPYTAWKLTPLFQLKEITLTSIYRHSYQDWDIDMNGTSHHISDIHPSREAAIAWGRERVEKQQAALDKSQIKINKRIAALNKAEGK